MSSRRKSNSSKKGRSKGRRKGRSSLQSLIKETSLSSTTLMKRPLTMWFRASPLLLVVNNATSVFTGTPEKQFTAQTDLGTVGAGVVSRFQDYRFLAIKATVYPLVNSGGITAFGYSEEDTTNIASYAASSNAKFIANTYLRPPQSLMWRATSLGDLGFTPTDVTLTVPFVTFWAYTNTADFGTPSNATGSAQTYFRVEFDVQCQFRGTAQG